MAKVQLQEFLYQHHSPHKIGYDFCFYNWVTPEKGHLLQVRASDLDLFDHRVMIGDEIP